MNCPYCQAPLVPGATFCASCGNNVSAFTQANLQTQLAQPSQPQQPAPIPMPASQPLGQPFQAPTPAMGVPPGQPAVSGMYPPMGMSGGYGVPAQSSGYGMPTPQSGGFFVPGQLPVGMSGPYPYGAQAQPSGVVPGGAPALTFGANYLRSFFGPTIPPQMAQPYTRAQRFLMQTISPRLAVNMWVTAALGAVVAIAGALLLTLGALALWSATLDAALSSLSSSSQFGSLISSGTKSLLTPTVFQLFALEQHSPLDFALLANSSASTGSVSGALDFGFPLTGLLLAPIVGLTLGGYISAASDFQRSARYSMLRGALIAPFYALLAAIVALIATQNTSTSFLVATFTVTTTVSFVQTFFYALLWGLIFGALGGWLHYSGANFLSWAQAALQRQRNARIIGALAGGVTTYVVGFLLSLVAVMGYFIYSFVVGAATATPSAATTTPSTPTSPTTALAGTIGSVIILIVVVAPTLAMWLFSFATGASITETVTGSSFSSSGGTTTGASSYSLLGSSSTIAGQAPTHVSPFAFLLVIIPLIAYLAGGRVAARVARATNPGEGFVAGALMAIPLSLMMAFLAACAGLSFSLSISIVSASVNYGPDALQVFLATLLVGAIVGGLGGMSLFSLPQLGALPRLLAIPARPLGLALSPLFDRLTHKPVIGPRSQSREWLYDGIAIGLLLAVIVIALDIVSVVSASLIPFKTLVTIDGVVVGLMVALPLAFFVGSFATAFTTPTATAAPILPPIPAPMPQVAPGFAPGFVPGMTPGFVPMQPIQPMQSGAFMPPAMPGMPATPSMPYGVMAQPMPPMSPPYPAYTPYPPYGYSGVASGSIPVAPIPVAPDASLAAGGVGGASPVAIPQAFPPSPSGAQPVPPQASADQQPIDQPDANR